VAPEVVAFGETVAAPAPSDVAGAECVDVGVRHRLCYRGDEATPVERSLPDVSLPVDAQWRCFESGTERRCEAMRERPFECEGESCVQRFPRLPNDGPTECAEVEGLVVCRTRATAAGVVAGPDAVGWICNVVETDSDEAEPRSMRICVDLAPDRPPGGGECHFEHQPTIHRVCDATARTTGHLGEAEPCAEGLVSLGDHRCLPARLPRAECWTSVDCPEGLACVLSSCVVSP
jgi:hypothetical protein